MANLNLTLSISILELKNMNLKHRPISHIGRLFFSILLVFAVFDLSAQIEISTDRNNANYEVGETAFFEVTSSKSGTVSYVLKYDDITPIISSGTISISSGQTVSIPHIGSEAEVVICEATFDNDKEIAAAVFSANDIPTLSEEPADFDAFWADQVALAREVDLDAKVIYHSETDDVKNYRINIEILDNRRMYGYISVPKEGDNFPAIVKLPPFSAGANLATPEDFTAYRGKAIAVSLSIHNVEADEVDPEAYSPNDITDREGYYYRYAILGTVRIIDYLFTRSDFDGQNISMTGVSQGAGLSLIVAGLDNRVKALTISNPALSRHGAYNSDKASGFPYFIHKSKTRPYPEDLALTKEASKYYDAVFFAKRYKGDALVNISYIDLVTPAATSFAALKELRNNTIVVHSTKLGHYHPGEFWSGSFDFWRNVFPSMINPPFFVDTGYWVDASASTNTTDINQSVNLNAEVVNDGDTNSSFPVKWEVVEGPTRAQFSNPSIKNPTVSFTEPGLYTLKVTATDDSELEDEDFFHTISDFVVIEVLPPADLIRPTCVLSFLRFDANDNAIVNVDFSEPITGLETSDFNITNGNVIDITENGDDFILAIEPISSGDLIVSLPAGKVADPSGNTNTLSNELKVFIEPVDNIRPTCSLSLVNVNNDGDVVINVLFSEDVTGLTSTDFNLTNGDALSLTGSGNEYILTVTPLVSGTVTIFLPPNVSEDAAENGNIISNELTVTVTSTVDFEKNSLKVYPNPAHSIFYLDLEKYNGKSATVKIYNELGQLDRSINLKKISNEPQAITTEGLTKGIYFISIKIEDDILLSKKITLL